MKKYIHNKYKKKLYNNLLKKGNFGFKINEFKRLSKEQKIYIEYLTLKSLKAFCKKKKIKYWSTIYCNQILTKLSSESRMGKGKGLYLSEAVFIKPGMILIEIDEINNNIKTELHNNLKKCVWFKINYIDRYNN